MTVTGSLAERMGLDPFLYESHLPVLETCLRQGPGTTRPCNSKQHQGEVSLPSRILHPSTYGLPAFGYGYYYVHSRALPIEAREAGEEDDDDREAPLSSTTTTTMTSTPNHPLGVADGSSLTLEHDLLSTAKGLPLSYFAEARRARELAVAQAGRHVPYHHPPTPIQQETLELYGLHFECPGFQGLALAAGAGSFPASAVPTAGASLAATASKPHATWIVRNRARGPVTMQLATDHSARSSTGSNPSPTAPEAREEGRMELMRDDILPLATGVGYVFHVQLVPNPQQRWIEEERLEMEIHLYLH